MSRGTEWVELGDCEVVRVTDMALLIDVGGSEEWFPPVADSGRRRRLRGRDRDGLAVTPWIAKKKGIET